MNDILFTPVRLSTLESLIQSSVERAIKSQTSKPLAPTEEPNQLMTVDDLCALLHLTKATIYSKHSKGEIPGVCKQGKRLFFQRDVIINWIKQGRIKSSDEILAEAEAHLISTKKGGAE